jgi:hypothetical protein
LKRTLIAVLLLLAVGLFTGCNKTRESSVSAAPTETPKPTFTDVQDDQQGYAGIKWGVGIADLDPKAAQQSQQGCFGINDRNGKPDNVGTEDIAAAFLPPPQDQFVGSVALPIKCKSVSKDDDALIFYNDKFAMAFAFLSRDNYDAVVSDMKSKFVEMGDWSFSWSREGLGNPYIPPKFTVTVNVRLFKRGNTNTRVFLLKSVPDFGDARLDQDYTHVRLLYVPNAYYQNVLEDMAELKRGQQRQQQAQQLFEEQKKQQREQPDLQKIQ